MSVNKKSASWIPRKWVKSNAWRRRREKKFVLTMAKRHYGWQTKTAWNNMCMIQIVTMGEQIIVMLNLPVCQ